jgi:hypothetical protein
MRGWWPESTNHLHLKEARGVRHVCVFLIRSRMGYDHENHAKIGIKVKEGIFE